MVAEFASRAQQLKELQLEGNLSPGDSLHSLGRALVQVCRRPYFLFPVDLPLRFQERDVCCTFFFIKCILLFFTVTQV